MQEGRRPATRSDLRPREGVWSARPLPVRRTARPLPGYWQPFVYGPWLYGTLAQILQLPNPNWLAYVFLAGLLAWSALALVWWISEAIALRELKRDRAFSDAPPGVEEYTMEIVLYDAHGALGSDRGFAWFDEGRLIFNGSACSFALAADDFSRHGRGSGPRRDAFSKVPKNALHLRAGRGTAYIHLRPLIGMKGLRFRHALKRFLTRSVGTEAARQWPPLVPYAVAYAIQQSAQRARDRVVDALQ